MADFLSGLVGQVLGAEQEVRPLLPPRFARWPGIPPADVAPRPPEPADAPARADTALLPNQLIDADAAAVDAPLPTFQQMGQLRSASGPAVEPAQTPAPQDRPETADSEQDGPPRDMVRPSRLAVDDAPPHAPAAASPSSLPSPASPPQAEADGDAEGAAITPPAPRGAGDDRPAKEMGAVERGQAVPPPLSPPPASTPQAPPQPAAGQERPASSAKLTVPPARTDGLLRPSQAEPADAQSLAPAPASEPLAAQPASAEVGPGVQHQSVSDGPPVAPAAPQPVSATEPDTPTPPTGRAASGWGEPTIVPSPAETSPATRAEAGALLRPTAARPTVGETEPAPTVRVTIGRVVVRASLADERPPSRRAELPRPPVSLEEYLEGRQGGER